MPAAVREELVAGLADILVRDYQQQHGVTAPTVVEGWESHRGRKRMKSKPPRVHALFIHEEDPWPE